MAIVVGLAMGAGGGAPGGLAAQQPGPVPAGAQSQAALSAQDLAQQFVEALGRGEGAVGMFVASTFTGDPRNDEPRDRMLTRLKALARQSGGVDVKEWSPQGERVFFSGTTRRGGFPVDGMAAVRDGKLIHFEMFRDPRARGADAPAWPPTATAPADAARAVEAEIDWRARQDRFSGSVLIAHRGKPVLERAWGMAARGRDIPNAPDTLFTTASTSKMFTSAAIARLIDQGRLRLDTRIAAVVPALATAPGAADVTIADLLGHRVSYGDYFEDRKRHPQLAQHATATQLLGLIAGREPRRAPAGRADYSNSNYLVLAAAVEALTGKSLYDHLEAEVLRPAGMTRTTYAQKSQPERTALGWIKDETTDPLGLGDWQETGRGARGGPAGGAWSTARELWQFLDGVAAGRLIRAETLAAMLQDRRRLGPRLASALGFMAWGAEDMKFFGHSGGGGNHGVSTAAFITPDREWTVVVLSNFSSPSGEMLASDIMQYLSSLPAAPAPDRVAASK